MDSGAKAVICSSNEPPETQSTTFQTGEYETVENGKFEIGEEEGEDDEAELSSPVSDWEDSDAEKIENYPFDVWDDDEGELSQFVCHLYDSLFRERASVNAALVQALASHRKLRYTCHLPSVQ